MVPVVSRFFQNEEKGSLLLKVHSKSQKSVYRRFEYVCLITKSLIVRTVSDISFAKKRNFSVEGAKHQSEIVILVMG